MAVATFPSPARNADLDGPEQSWYRYTPDNGQCTVDATVNGNWIQDTVWADDTGGLPAPADRRSAAVDVMVDILPNIIGK